MNEALRRVVERARVEAKCGAPASMVAYYVAVEAEHAVAGCGGDAQSCADCQQVAGEAHAAFFGRA